MFKKIMYLGIALIVMAFSPFVFMGCDPKSKNISVKALFSGNILELPIPSKQSDSAAPGEYPIKLTSIDEIYTKISIDKSLEVKCIDQKIFISKDNGDKTKDYFVVRKLLPGAEEEDIYYEFFNMEGYCYCNDGISEFYQSFLVPYHLFKKDKSFEYSKLISQNIRYETNFFIEDFYEFYNGSGWYDVEKGDGYILINGYVDIEKVVALKTPKYSMGDLDFRVPIKIEVFSSTNVLNFVQFSTVL